PPPVGQFPVVDAGDREREPGLVLGTPGPGDRRLRYGRLVVSGIPHPVRGRDARRGNRCGESLPEGRVRADPQSRGRGFSDCFIPSRTRRWTKSVPTVNSRLRESWTEDTLGSVWRTWVFAVNSPRLSARQKRYFIGGPWVSWTRTASRWRVAIRRRKRCPRPPGGRRFHRSLPGIRAAAPHRSLRLG